MTVRLNMPSAMPVEICERISDLGDLSDAEMRQLWAEQDIAVRDKLADAGWWTEVLNGYNAASDMLPAILARVMANLENGDTIGIAAIMQALRQLQREARVMARKEVEL